MSELTMDKILLVDDEQAIRDNISAMLKRSGYQVSTAVDGEAALEEIKTFNPDLVVLDVLMPRLDGREVLRRVRQAGNWVPIILLTQVGESDERAMALEEGADDYLNKPFAAHELVARIKALLRRSKLGQPSLESSTRLKAGDLSIDRTGHRAWLNGKELPLTPKAMTLLEYFMTHPGDLIPRDRLLDAVWGWDYPAGTRAVDSRVAELRRVLNDDSLDPVYIETVPGYGYRFLADVEPQ